MIGWEEIFGLWGNVLRLRHCVEFIFTPDRCRSGAAHGCDELFAMIGLVLFHNLITGAHDDQPASRPTDAPQLEASAPSLHQNGRLNRLRPTPTHTCAAALSTVPVENQ